MGTVISFNLGASIGRLDSGYRLGLLGFQAAGNWHLWLLFYGESERVRLDDEEEALQVLQQTLQEAAVR